MLLSPTEKKKAYTTTTTERKSFGELFWLQRKTFQTGGRYKNPIKTRKTISTTKIFPLWHPFLFRKEKFCTGAGRCAFFFPAPRKNGRTSSFKEVRVFNQSLPKGAGKMVPRENCRKVSKSFLTLFDDF